MARNLCIIGDQLIAQVLPNRYCMKKINLVSLVIVVCFSMLLTACQDPFVSSSSTNRLARQNLLTVWSFFPNQSMDILIKNYQAIHPETEVIHTSYPFSALPDAFRERASQGLGPDAVILTEREIPTLIEAGLIEDLNQYKLNPGSFATKATVSLYGSNRHLYGVPFAFQTMALCYNRSQVSTPATTLDDWLEQSRNGVGIAIESGFLKSMWGIGAFGGEFFDVANRFILQEKI